MTPIQKDQVAYLWHIEKSDTRAIADRLSLKESDVYNTLSQRIKPKLPSQKKVVVIGWTPAEVAMAKSLAGQGYSMAAIGKELGRTKNAVISRLRRKPKHKHAEQAA
jgi:prolyl-tRNA editing enzyme YbaK/EbsC (Cys-tRNA(Pro) deacylase)